MACFFSWSSIRFSKAANLSSVDISCRVRLDMAASIVMAPFTQVQEKGEVRLSADTVMTHNLYASIGLIFQAVSYPFR
eukprot:18406-Eustigmatos_ZCMA.PRE.1